MRLELNGLVHPLLLLSGLLLTAATTAGAEALEELQHTGRLKISTWTEPVSPAIVRQQVLLHIEIATDRWFGGGTRIGHVDVEDAIVLQRQTFAVNSTRREGNQTWVVQQWTLSIYPQRAGNFDIPSIPIQLSIAGEDATTSITGTLHTTPLSFTAIVPDALRDTDKHWIVTTRLEVTEQYNQPLDGLNPGDALIRTIRLSADNVPAMMLPAITPEDIQGVSVYPKPPHIEDRVNRGDYLARRTEVFTYVFEKPGTYHLPARTFFWWNPESGMLESVQLEAQTLHVGGETAFGAGVKPDGNIPSWRGMAAGILALLMIAWILWRIRGIHGQRQSAKQSALPSESELRQHFERACRRNDAREAIRFLYQWLDIHGGASFTGSVRRSFHGRDQQQLLTTFDKVMHLLYGSAGREQVDLAQFARQFVQQHKQHNRFSPDKWWTIRLTLN